MIKASLTHILICEGCGEYYNLNDFSKNNPLDICGECGAEYFINYAADCMKGYTSLDHYIGLIDLIPAHIKEVIPPELCSKISPFRE